MVTISVLFVCLFAFACQQSNGKSTGPIFMKHGEVCRMGQEIHLKLEQIQITGQILVMSIRSFMMLHETLVVSVDPSRWSSLFNKGLKTH